MTRASRSAAKVATAIAGALLLATPVGAELSAATREALVESDLVYTATDRADGTRSSVAPVWFWYDGESDSLYTTTSPESWKAKRIARGSPLHIWVGSEDGPYLIGEPERVSDPETVTMMGEKYSDKYLIAWIGFFRPRADRVTEGDTIAYRVKLRPGDPSSGS